MIKRALIMALACIGLFAYSDRVAALADPLTKVNVMQKTCTDTASKVVATTVYGQAWKFENTGEAQDNVDANEVYLGGSDVNVTTKGWLYNVGEADAFDIDVGAFWCVTNTGEETVLTLFVGKKGP